MSSPLRKRCASDDLYRTVKEALNKGGTYKFTKSGIIIYGPRGTASAHVRGGDGRRALRNFRAQLRRIGL